MNATQQTPAIDLANQNGVRFPNESGEYREARDALLAEEIELRRHIERVAEQRRALPPGGDFIPVSGLSRQRIRLVTSAPIDVL